ncbi:MAG TPA: site-2 protease family protein [Candidatus Sulfotelmatobacter sp.]|nr:site-2 protease family protein [Candidatus Sulfotelmatobacter sp.]
MTLQHVDYVFQVIAFLFAISFHESAHAWMANRCGDPTARMLGRITLNPAKHIDPVGTVLLPMIALIYHVPLLGWAKPTPVDPRNFRNLVLDDIKTSVVGPVSNFVIACGALVILLGVALTSRQGNAIVGVLPYSDRLESLATLPSSILIPFSLLAYDFMLMNIVLAVFNLVPIPPLDGSHVLRHFLPDGALKVYDAIGWFGLMALVYFAPGVLGRLIFPVLGIFHLVLLIVTNSH